MGSRLKNGLRPHLNAQCWGSLKFQIHEILHIVNYKTSSSSCKAGKRKATERKNEIMYIYIYTVCIHSAWRDTAFVTVCSALPWTTLLIFIILGMFLEIISLPVVMRKLNVVILVEWRFIMVPVPLGHWKGVTVRPSTLLSAGMSLHMTWVSVFSLKTNYLKSGWMAQSCLPFPSWRHK